MMGATNLFKSATAQLETVASENPSVGGWVPELEQQVEKKEPRRSFASRPPGSFRRASPVAFTTMIHGDGAAVLWLVADLTSPAEELGCNPAGNTIVCGGKYEF